MNRFPVFSVISLLRVLEPLLPMTQERLNLAPRTLKLCHLFSIFSISRQCEIMSVISDVVTSALDKIGQTRVAPSCNLCRTQNSCDYPLSLNKVSYSLEGTICCGNSVASRQQKDTCCLMVDLSIIPYSPHEIGAGSQSKTCSKKLPSDTEDIEIVFW